MASLCHCCVTATQQLVSTLVTPKQVGASSIEVPALSTPLIDPATPRVALGRDHCDQGGTQMRDRALCHSSHGAAREHTGGPQTGGSVLERGACTQHATHRPSNAQGCSRSRPLRPGWHRWRHCVTAVAQARKGDSAEHPPPTAVCRREAAKQAVEAAARGCSHSAGLTAPCLNKTKARSAFVSII